MHYKHNLHSLGVLLRSPLCLHWTTQHGQLQYWTFCTCLLWDFHSFHLSQSIFCTTPPQAPLAIALSNRTFSALEILADLYSPLVTNTEIQKLQKQLIGTNLPSCLETFLLMDIQPLPTTPCRRPPWALSKPQTQNLSRDVENPQQVRCFRLSMQFPHTASKTHLLNCIYYWQADD